MGCTTTRVILGNVSMLIAFRMVKMALMPSCMVSESGWGNLFLALWVIPQMRANECSSQKNPNTTDEQPSTGSRAWKEVCLAYLYDN